jgi:hypothetical protein
VNLEPGHLAVAAHGQHHQHSGRSTSGEPHRPGISTAEVVANDLPTLCSWVHVSMIAIGLDILDSYGDEQD